KRVLKERNAPLIKIISKSEETLLYLLEIEQI
ncbi:unnamed protein product, partial [marine sediment metagenome]